MSMPGAAHRQKRGIHMKNYPRIWILIALSLIVSLSACIVVPDGEHHGDYHGDNHGGDYHADHGQY
jgi:hypothetical protein